MKKYNTVIFDLDGTLLNTLKDLTDATNYALEKYGQPQHSIEVSGNLSEMASAS